MLVVLSCAALCGCNRRTDGNGPAMSLATDPRIAHVLRSQTDALMRVVAIGDLERVRQFFGPGVNVDVRDQVRRYLNAPPGGFHVAAWDGEQIVVELSADRRRARTGVLVDFQASGSQLMRTAKVVFNWVSSDETCDVYYLAPLD